MTAADLLDWHFRMLHAADEILIFRPQKDRKPTRAERREWLVNTLLAALPVDEEEARTLVKDVTPHAFRAGLAGDLVGADVAWRAIAMWCRWHSMRAMRMYASRQALFTVRRSLRFRVITR